MATTNKILGASAPAATTNTTLYTVPAVTQANGNLFVCNRGNTNASFRIAVTVNGQSLNAKDYIAYDSPIAPAQTVNISGICLNTGDFCTVYSSTSMLSFVLMGIETT
jgi:uncharacterized secreted protein with C-terminal beta-propeller domain